MSVIQVYGDLLKFKNVDAICHQVNGVCTKPHGLSSDIGEEFPWRDIYRRRRSENGRNLAIKEDRDDPGTIRIFSSPDETLPHIVCLIAQWDFGRPG